jgi:hypothetical protein
MPASFLPDWFIPIGLFFVQNLVYIDQRLIFYAQRYTGDA